MGGEESRRYGSGSYRSSGRDHRRPGGFERIQLDAMKVLIRAVKTCYCIVRDVDVELLEDELERIKEENQRAGGARGELGYEVEG